MNPVCKASFKVLFSAFLCLGLDALAEFAVPRGDVVLEKAEAEKPVEAPAKAEDVSAQAEAAGGDQPGRNAERARIDAVNEKIAARKKAVIAENKAAAKVNEEIEAMAREVQKTADAMAVKQAELDQLLQADKTMAELNREIEQAYDSLRTAKEKTREQRIKSHREHLMLPPATTAEAVDAKAGEGIAK